MEMKVGNSPKYASSTRGTFMKKIEEEIRERKEKEARELEGAFSDVQKFFESDEL